MATKKKKTPRPPRQKKKCIACPPKTSEHPVKDFFKSKNPLYADGYIPICRECLYRLVYDYETDDIDMQKFQNVMQQIDTPWIPRVMDSAISQYNKKNMGKPVELGARKVIIGCYFKNLNLSQFKEMNWQDGVNYCESMKIKENKSNVVMEDGYKLKYAYAKTNASRTIEAPPPVYLEDDPDDDFVLTKDMVKLFGAGYDLDTYKRMWDKYIWLKENYVEVTNFHTEALVSYIRPKVQEEIAIARGDVDSAKEWSAQAAKAADAAKLNPKQLSKSDLEGGLNSFSELSQAIEQAVDVIPILPHFKFRPNDAVDFIMMCYINYARALEDKPLCSYEDIYKFYDRRKQAYLEQYGDPTGIFTDDPTEKNRAAIEQFIVTSDDSTPSDGEPEEVVIGGN